MSIDTRKLYEYVQSKTHTQGALSPNILRLPHTKQFRRDAASPSLKAMRQHPGTPIDPYLGRQVSAEVRRRLTARAAQETKRTHRSDGYGASIFSAFPRKR